ncbi:hypothetical protein [Synechococcus sp. UW140]|uniref:hypothetical protein n=1 Tax=Synechococcus sp. UW140 TaxID=368503 RepID=UPI00313806E4
MTELSPILMRAIATAVAISCAISMPSFAEWQNKNEKPKSPPAASLIQKLRSFLGLNPPVAVGGSRSDNEKMVCLVSPWPGTPIGVSTPVLMALGPLNEIRIEKGDQVLWQQRASSTKAIEGAILWPIKPLEPGEKITLRVRPRGASGGDFASFNFQAADAKVLEENQEQVQKMRDDPDNWIKFLSQLTPQQAPIALGLLSSPQAPTSLRQSLQCNVP